MAVSGKEGIENLLKQAKHDLDRKILQDGLDQWADFLAILDGYSAMRAENERLRERNEYKHRCPTCPASLIRFSREGRWA